MSEFCRHCGVLSRDACSAYYSGLALIRELRRCPNLDEGQREPLVEHLLNQEIDNA